MFWSKARRIKELNQLLDAADRSIVDLQNSRREIEAGREQLRQKLGQQLSSALADRDAARAAVEGGQNMMNDAEQKILSALADRDQFAKRVEELEEKIAEMSRPMNLQVGSAPKNSVLES